MNKIILLGRLAQDPEIKYAQNGTAVARFTLAVTRENDRNKTDFFYCTAFGKLAQSVTDYCQKGRQVLLEGRIEINVVPDQQGNKTYINVVVNSCEFLAKPQQQVQSPQPTNQNQRQYTKEQLMNAYNGQAIVQNQQPAYKNPPQYQQNMNNFNPTEPAF